MEMAVTGEEERSFGEFRRKVRSLGTAFGVAGATLYPQFILRAGSAWWCRMAAC